MARQTLKRSEWRHKHGAWTCSIGERGQRVRLFQNRSGGMFYRAVWRASTSDRQKPFEDRQALGTTDKAEALKLGRLLLAELLRGELAASPAQRLTLAQLWRWYSTECAAYNDNTPSSKRAARDSVRVLLGYLGEDFQVDKLDEDSQRSFERARQIGGIRPVKDSTLKRKTQELTRPVRARAAERDVQHLHIMLRWAVKKRLLTINPLAGVTRVREKNKKQPVATWERYEATVAAMRELRAEARSDAAELRWARMECALFLAEQTGKRLGSIRKLDWQDFKHSQQTVYWRAEADKKGYQWDVPMPATFFKAIRQYQKQIGAVGGYVFADESAPDGIINRSLFDYLLKAAEAKAGLAKLDGGLWHAYRRKWAIERKHLPLRDVAEAGGWKDTHTLLSVYQQPDKASLLAVTSVTLKLREQGVA